MLRLRTTTGLSALALLVGVAGTGWLSGLTPHWREPSARVAMVAAPRTPSNRHRSRGLGRPVPQPRRAGRQDAAADGATHAPVSAISSSLQPLGTPPDVSQSWDQLRGHLDGRVTLRVRIGATGRVASASVTLSSGDPILDQHALRSVRGWWFAVPPGHPDGLSGELPMRFSSRQRGAGML